MGYNGLGATNVYRVVIQLVHINDSGGFLEQLIDWAMPLASGPQAVVCAAVRASSSVCAAAVAQLVLPLNSIHTSHVFCAEVTEPKITNPMNAAEIANITQIVRLSKRSPVNRGSQCCESQS